MTPSAHAILSILLDEGPTFAHTAMSRTGMHRVTAWRAVRELEALRLIEPHKANTKLHPMPCCAEMQQYSRVEGACVKCGGVLVGQVKNVCRQCSNALRRDLVPLAAGVDLYRRTKQSATPLTPYAIAIRLEWPVWSRVVDGKIQPGMADAIIESGEMSDEDAAKWKKNRADRQRSAKNGGAR